MNEEIKEILNNIKNKYKDYYVQDIVSGDDLKLLLDYITNLQQENESLKEVQCTFLGTGCKKQLKDYKSRTDKAIEFIKEKRKVFEWYDTDLFYLESLLKGDSDE